MQEQDGKKQFNISERLEDLRREHEALRWEGSFREYFELVAQNPRIAQLSHARINDMVHAAGVERLNEGTQHEILSYRFFDNELFGIEEPIARIVEYFKSAAQRLEVCLDATLVVAAHGHRGRDAHAGQLVEQAVELLSEHGSRFGLRKAASAAVRWREWPDRTADERVAAAHLARLAGDLRAFFRPLR